jgi:hypothetical protein
MRREKWTCKSKNAASRTGFAADIADRAALPGLIERGGGTVLFGLPVTASVPVPPFGSLATVGAAARHKSPPTSPTPSGTSTSSATGSTKSSE